MYLERVKEILGEMREFAEINRKNNEERYKIRAEKIQRLREIISPYTVYHDCDEIHKIIKELRELQDEIHVSSAVATTLEKYTSELSFLPTLLEKLERGVENEEL